MWTAHVQAAHWYRSNLGDSSNVTKPHLESVCKGVGGLAKYYRSRSSLGGWLCRDAMPTNVCMHRKLLFV